MTFLESQYNLLPLSQKFKLLLADYKRLARYADKLEERNANLQKENERLESERGTLYLKGHINRRNRHNAMVMFVEWLKNEGFILINEESIELKKLIEQFEQKQMANNE